jgi:hypothetical protein
VFKSFAFCCRSNGSLLRADGPEVARDGWRRFPATARDGTGIAIYLAAAAKIHCELLTSDSWQVEGKRDSVAHVGCGTRLVRDATRVATELLCESHLWCNSRHMKLMLLAGPFHSRLPTRPAKASCSCVAVSSFAQTWLVTAVNSSVRSPSCRSKSLKCNVRSSMLPANEQEKQFSGRPQKLAVSQQWAFLSEL